MGGSDPVEQTPGWLRAPRTEGALLGAVAIACLVPFVGKPIHLDDPLFVWTARQILKAPLDFYGFDVNWHGFTDVMANANKNPPLTAFYLAAAAALFGFSEVALHLAMLIPALAAVLGSWALARRLCSHPALAALAMLAMPAFLVSATPLMADVVLLACWVWSLFLWWSGLEDGRPARLVAAGGIVGLAILAKFVAVALLPLLMAVTWARERRVDARWLAFAVPVGMFGAYLAFMSGRYGIDLRETVAGYAFDSRTSSGANLFRSLAVAAFFAGGSFLSVVAYAPLLWRGRRGAAWLAISVVGGVVLGSVAGLPVGLNLVSLHAIVFAAGALALGALLVGECRHASRGDAALLVLWIGGIAIFTVALNWTINARSLLPAAPAVAIVLVRALEREPGVRLEGWRVGAPLAICLGVSLWVAWGDTRLATEARDAARLLAPAGERVDDTAGSLWFEGAWGFQYYMEERGVPKVDAMGSLLRAGDRVVVPLNNTNQWIPPVGVAELVEELRRPTGGLVASQSRAHGAGFYSDRYGPLPFVIGVEPVEVYQVYVLGATLRLRGHVRE